MFKTGVLLLGAVLLLTLISGKVFAQAEPQKKLTAEQWRTDLRFLSEELRRRHKNLFHKITREQFDEAVKKLDERIPNLADHEIVVGIMRIVAMIGDGHTGFNPIRLFNTEVYPVRFYVFNDGLFVQSAAREYEEIVGGRVIKIGNTTPEQALNAAGEITPRDNEMGIKSLTPLLLTMPEVLHALRLSEDMEKLKIVVSLNGRERTVELKPTAKRETLFASPSEWIDARSKSSAPTPLWAKDRNNKFWFEYLKDERLLYVQYNEVGNKQDETVASFFDKVFAFIEANAVEKLAIDVRFNGGGNNGLNRPIIIGLIKSKINQRGKLFVITGRETFSAAQNFVNEAEKYTNAIFVGEPTGGKPNHYGDAVQITLPNSGFRLRASTIWWQDVDPRDVRQWTAPEIAAEFSYEDYRTNTDPALKAILNYKPEKSLSDIFAEALAKNDISLFLKSYGEYRSNPAHKYISTEGAINRIGYQLLQQKRVDDAINVFKLNVEAYPNSANVYDSLGDAYVAKGEKELAIKSYEKALQINPEYPSSIESLRRLKSL